MPTKLPDDVKLDAPPSAGPQRLPDDVKLDDSGGEKVFYNDAGQPFTLSGKPPPQSTEYTGTILPLKRDEAGLHLAVPEAVTAPLRGAMTGGARATGVGEAGQNPLRPLSGDEMAASALGVHPVQSLFGRAPSAVMPAVDALGTKATDMVSRRIASDTKAGGLTAVEALDAMRAGKAAGKPMTLTDVGGENARGLAGFVARQPGESKAIAQKFLTEREAGASERLSQDIAKYVHGDASMRATTENLLTARSRAARPLYEQAEELQGIWSPRLQQFIEEPRVKRGMARGFELERLDALAEGRPFDPTAMGIELDAEGNVKLLKVPNLRVLDMGKRGLDAMIADERDPLTGRITAMGRSLDMVRHAYVGELDNLDSSGLYKAARAAWAGPSQSLDSLRFGRTIFNRTPEETAAEFARLSPNDQEFARLGVADVLKERIAKTGFTGDESRAVIKNPWTREQLRPILRSDEEFNKFVDAVMAERTMAGTTKKVLGGSQTAERVAEDTSPQNRAIYNAAQAAWHAGKGNMFSAALHAWRFTREMKMRPNPELNERVAKLLFSPDPEFVERQMAVPPAGPNAVDKVLSSLGISGGVPESAAVGLRQDPSQPRHDVRQ